MEMFNFSSTETSRIKQALGFISPKEMELAPLLARTMIVKTENFADEREQLAASYPPLGLEDGNALSIFNTTRDGMHTILFNASGSAGLSFIHAVIAQVVHLGNLSRFNSEHGNIYRLTVEQAMADFYYEFLLWTKFQAMKIATRAHALVSWHEMNGEQPPQDGRYRFAGIDFPLEPVNNGLQHLINARDIDGWRRNFWDFLDEISIYFGRLAFYQQAADPAEVDERFPADAIEQAVGLENGLLLYAALQAAREYAGWKEMRTQMRRAIVAMQGYAQQMKQTAG